ncbi:MAG: hypothetical protein JO089_00115 [Alphaproteobacteria bacterium]|nr:hypothetical protein [Alphaproteobacteria bacterium]
MNKMTLLAALASVAFVTPAFAQTPATDTTTGSAAAEAAQKGPGKYSSETKEKVKVSKSGATKDVTESETVSDPKGLGNKVKHKTKHVKKTDKNGNVTKDKTTVDGKTTDNTKTGQ